MPSFSLPQKLTQCRLTETKRLERNSLIYSQGETAQVFYFLQRGLVGLYHSLENGKETLIRLYHANQYFGFRTLFSDTDYHCTARVLQDAEIVRIHPVSKAVFLAENPQFSQYLIKQLANELYDAEHRLTNTAYKRSYERVIEAITNLTENYPDYPWTYREVAEFCGCETETAIRISRELKKQGILDKSQRHLKICE
ncbi:Crp/Fnr family transcriptional regulator [Rodentibacter trehalosifermentans]|uniref:cAMP-binding protein n=1 Tax=Rodentibacter trehalosifermentans TaxID=1908263 RepID=A0A1V3J4T7_9PAST|nr:Crp/Fnr family transcriptional regulator [Rodentibacter trehalosifermentans]OOF46456.1 cAMP-binding protein [Rodentibacter trehalosifermentans]OOF49891.1 cAMP-binding protein [Rodentibacter trehalosifermentans]OOF52656.1 cAMP-binding protein [Rodentibacter trehalosifermentans]